MIDFDKASFKDFENIPGIDLIGRAKVFTEFLNFMEINGHMNYRLLAHSGCGPEMEIELKEGAQPRNFVSFVSNDYLGLTQHPKVKKAVIDAVEKFGTGAGASPLIGGFFSFHKALEKEIASFFNKASDCSALFTTGYTANSATLQCLLQKEDIAIIDSSVHASVYEGCILTNRKSFPHNDLESLERTLQMVKVKYRTKLIIVDGVYSQDGDLAPLEKISELAKRYEAMLMVDDAHGIGVIGATGRGVLENHDALLDSVDIITGTFSKSFGNIGGFVISSPEIIALLKFQSKQHIFSATSPPSSAGIVKAIQLIDEEPSLRTNLWENINYFKQGLSSLGFDLGTTASAIIPVKIGDPHKAGDAGKLLLDAGVYTNPILYPAVAKNNARIRMSIMSTHTKQHLDIALNAFEDVNKKLKIARLFESIA